MNIISRWFRDYPIVPFFFILLACAKFHFKIGGGTLHSPGLSGGLAVCLIVALVVTFKIFNAIQDWLVVNRKLGARISCKYDHLIWLTALAVFINGYWHGPSNGIPLMLANGEQTAYIWEFQWSDKALNGYFLLTITGLALLLRILKLIRESTAYISSAPSGLETK